MVTLVLYAILGVVVVSCLYWIATRIISQAEQISPPAPDAAPFQLTDAHLGAQDVIDVRLPVSVRGYRFAETDLLLDRLTEELRERDEEIARLHRHYATGEALPIPDDAGSPPVPSSYPAESYAAAPYTTGEMPIYSDDQAPAVDAGSARRTDGADGAGGDYGPPTLSSPNR